MKKKVYHLSTCSTCIRIIKDLGVSSDQNFTLQDIKTEKITPNQIEEMVKMASSYEALFSKRAMKFKSLGLGSQTLTEERYKQLILEEYTFLKRPVFVIRDSIFIGNSSKVIEEVRAALN